MKRGFCLIEKSGLGAMPAPKEVEALKKGYGYFCYHKCEPEFAAIRFAQIQIGEKFSHWMGMSLRRFFIGETRVTDRKYMKYPAELPELTEQEEEGPGMELLPMSPDREFLFWLCGLSRLRRLGVLEVKKVDGEDFLFPTEKFLHDLTKGIQDVKEIIQRSTSGRKART